MAALQNLETAKVSASLTKAIGQSMTLTLENGSKVPAFFIRLNLVDAEGGDVVPVVWYDNYVTLFPGEMLQIGVSWPVSYGDEGSVEVSGSNIGPMRTVKASQ